MDLFRLLWFWFTSFIGFILDSIGQVSIVIDRGLNNFIDGIISWDAGSVFFSVFIFVIIINTVSFLAAIIWLIFFDARANSSARAHLSIMKITRIYFMTLFSILFVPAVSNVVVDVSKNYIVSKTITSNHSCMPTYDITKWHLNDVAYCMSEVGPNNPGENMDQIKNELSMVDNFAPGSSSKMNEFLNDNNTNKPIQASFAVYTNLANQYYNHNINKDQLVSGINLIKGSGVEASTNNVMSNNTIRPFTTFNNVNEKDNDSGYIFNTNIFLWVLSMIAIFLVWEVIIFSKLHWFRELLISLVGICYTPFQIYFPLGGRLASFQSSSYLVELKKFYTYFTSIVLFGLIFNVANWLSADVSKLVMDNLPLIGPMLKNTFLSTLFQLMFLFLFLETYVKNFPTFFMTIIQGSPNDVRSREEDSRSQGSSQGSNNIGGKEAYASGQDSNHDGIDDGVEESNHF